MDLLARVTAEMAHAERTYGGYTSTHEALGVLAEEWDELRAAVHADDVCAIRDEAIQVAAVALRLAQACQMAHECPAGDPTHFARRSFKWAR